MTKLNKHNGDLVLSLEKLSVLGGGEAYLLYVHGTEHVASNFHPEGMS